MASFPHQPLPRPKPPMVYVTEKTVWEYKLLSRNLSNEETPSEEELNKLGKDGWELAAALTNGGVAQFYFKRLKD